MHDVHVMTSHKSLSCFSALQVEFIIRKSTGTLYYSKTSIYDHTGNQTTPELRPLWNQPWVLLILGFAVAIFNSMYHVPCH